MNGITRWSLAAALLGSLLPLAAGCSRREPSTPAATPGPGAAATAAIPPSPRPRIAFAEVTRETRRVGFALAPGPAADSLVIERERGDAGRWIIKRRPGVSGRPVTLDARAAALDEAGSIDLHGSGTRDVFFVTSMAGSGLTTHELNLYCARTGALLTRSLTFMHDLSDPVPSVVSSDELERPDYAADAAFFDGIQRDYGYVTEQELERSNDPRHAFYLWKRDNASRVDGAAIRVRRFPGYPAIGSTVNDSLEIAGVRYLAYFKAGVIAYDAAANQHWVIFHPDDPYDWPTRLAAAGDVLVIGTRGEGLAVLDLSSLAMRRVRVPANDDVESLAIQDGVIVVNGSARVALPAF